MNASDFELAIPEVFGTFTGLSEVQRRDVISYLHSAWRCQFGRDASSLTVDLQALASLYAPALQAKKLRSMAEALVKIPGRRPHIDETLFIAVDDERGFVTPEGRLLLELWEMPSVQIDSGALLRQLVDFYAAPRREWTSQVFVGGDLRPASIGFIVFLLLNDSTSASRALALPLAPVDDERLADAVLPVVNAFVVEIGARPLTGRERSQLRGNWAVTESRRQLPGIVRHDVVKRVGRIYIQDGKEFDAIDAIAKALAIRRGVDSSDVARALEQAAQTYAVHRSLLKSWGLSWETQHHTSSVRDNLIGALETHAGYAAS